jgi:hypothetical protein
MSEDKKCERCKKPIDETSDRVFSNKDGKFWCDERCLGIRVPDFSRPQPHFE